MAAAYKLSTVAGWVIRIADGAQVPPDAANKDRRTYQAWLDLGNIPDPVEPPTAAELAETSREDSIIADPTRADLLNRLQTNTKADIAAWVDTQVTNPEVRAMIKRLLLLMAPLFFKRG